ncbi:TonB-dependent receptor [Flectobacillus major]|uniref:TonB-dependent receptor n=1 Tax=Flectobacillus major TaxID=103 RepID=UPI00047C1D94|nr:TonB-dependent receptor [Flectobacillus major]
MKLLRIFMAMLLCTASAILHAQVTGKVFDSLTKEPLVGATIEAGSVGTTTDINGNFSLKSTPSTLTVSFVGFKRNTMTVGGNKALRIGLEQQSNDLQQVVVTANREASLRTDAPVAIAKLTPLQIADAKSTLMFELLNKVPGVMMVNLNNEQHQMAIRQPFTTNAYFLYLEDGLPLRPMGVFNHNALIETNVFSVSSIEVMKGPASSLYGPEAVGGAVNVITQKPTAVPVARIGVQADNYGYKRVQYAAGGMITNKLGVFVGGFVAKQRNGWQTRSDYDKFSLNFRADYNFSDKTKLIGTLSHNDYNSQTGGSVDSIAFYNRAYTSQTDFTYRKVKATRASLKLQHQWNSQNESFLTAFYRDNAVGQNPSYSIRWTSGASTATGQINENSFKSYGFVAQHTKKFDFANAKLLLGTSYDYSPTTYWAYQIDLQAQLRADKKSVEKYTLLKERPDIYLANYDANLYNSAVYAQLELNPIAALKLVLGGRFDNMSFDYNNYLANTNGSKSYHQFTPKIGATYDLGKGIGVYANYSKGFSPPGLTSIFTKRPTPAPDGSQFYYNLEPASFDNYEIGGWASLFNNKVYIDWAAYQMDGRNELLNIRQPDNSTDYQSAGKTLHKGLEYSITYKPNAEWNVRFGGTNAIHRFVQFTLSTRATDLVKNVDGFDMPQAPKWIANTEVIYKPRYVKGLRVGLEYQKVSSWFQNQINTVSYEGYGIFNFRAGYQWKGIEVFTNIMNLTDELYAYSASRGNNATDRTTFTASAPRTFVWGIQYNFTGKH